jgi:hypothetical protein
MPSMLTLGYHLAKDARHYNAHYIRLKIAERNGVETSPHDTRMPKPATASIPALKLTFDPSIGVGLVVLLAGGGGGAGKGAEGGGAGGPSPTTGIPRSNSGSDERVFRPFLLPDLEPGREGGSGEMARSGSGVALSSSSESVGVSNLRPWKEFDGAASEGDCCASAATLVAEREGFIPRMGTARPSRGPVEFRIDWRKGAWSERTCMLVGRRRVLALGCTLVVCAMADEERLGGSGGMLVGIENWLGKRDSRAPEDDLSRPVVFAREDVDGY